MSNMCLVQLMIASTDDSPYVYSGEVGGSVVNALHFGRDPRGEQTPSVCLSTPTWSRGLSCGAAALPCCVSCA